MNAELLSKTIAYGFVIVTLIVFLYLFIFLIRWLKNKVKDLPDHAQVVNVISIPIYTLYVVMIVMACYLFSVLYPSTAERQSAAPVAKTDSLSTQKPIIIHDTVPIAKTFSKEKDSLATADAKPKKKKTVHKRSVDKKDPCPEKTPMMVALKKRTIKYE